MKAFTLPLVMAIGFLLGCAPQKETTISSGEKLWYIDPAEEWEEALPLGNGRIGMMFFGKTSNERIQLNDDSMWPADLGWEGPEGNPEELKTLRQLLFDGKYEAADQFFVDKFSRKDVLRSHQTLGDLHINFEHANITDYRRELDLSTAIAKASYRSNGALVKEKAFVSNPDNAMIIIIESEAPDGLNGSVQLSRPDDEGVPTASTKTTSDDLLIMEGMVTQRSGAFDSKPVPILEGVKFETRLKIINEGGEVIKGEDFLELKNVRKASFIIVSNSSFYHDDYADQNQRDLMQMLEKDLAEVEKLHIKDHRSLYSKMRLSLADDGLDSLPTDQRIDRVKNGDIDVGLEQILFQYGRYLLIASSRAGTNPANLQGLWNKHITAPWNADYHLNINLQMNYWLANLTGLAELNYPLFDYVDRLVENGKTTATENFGCRGTFLPHATDLWAPTWLRARTAYWGCSVGAGGWMMQHYWQHFLFTQDTTFLKDRGLPAIQEVAQFFSDWIIEDPRDGMLISAPSTSPENRYVLPNGNAAATCLGSAMDQQIITEVFNNYLEACRVLDIQNELTNTIKTQLTKLRPGFVLGSDGRILEWDREYQEFEPGHRHMSHLYGFHPGNQVSKEKNPELFEAVQNTLDYRLEHGGAGTGWSRAWLINCSARLLDGEMAHEHIQLLFQKSIFTNLFDAHPPFQIDGNFGYTAGVAEMLVQSHESGIIRILPALPEAWHSGSVQGLKARGNLTLDFDWADNELKTLSILSPTDVQLELIYQEERIPLEVRKGEVFVYERY